MRATATAAGLLLVVMGCSPRQLNYIDRADGSSGGGSAGTGAAGGSGGTGGVIGQDDAGDIDAAGSDAGVAPWLPPCGDVSDDFDDNSFDSSKWTTYGGSLWSEQNGEVAFDLSPSVSATAYVSVATFTFAATAPCQVSIQLKSAPGTSVPGRAFLRIVEPGTGDPDGGVDPNQFGVYVSRDSSFVRSVPGGQLTFNYDNNYKWFRIRAESGQLVAEASADGANWWSLPVIARASTGKFRIEFGLNTHQAGAGKTTEARFDNLGVPPKS